MHGDCAMDFFSAFFPVLKDVMGPVANSNSSSTSLNVLWVCYLFDVAREVFRNVFAQSL